MNKIFIKGRLTKDPELRRTPSDVTVCEISVAVPRRYQRETTDFFNCQAWRQTGEFINKYFKKGQEILIAGEIHIDKWEKDGEYKTATRIMIEDVEFCGSKTETETSASSQPIGFNFDDISESDDLPFN